MARMPCGRCSRACRRARRSCWGQGAHRPLRVAPLDADGNAGLLRLEDGERRACGRRGVRPWACARKPSPMWPRASQSGDLPFSRRVRPLGAPHAASFLIARACQLAAEQHGWRVFFAYADPMAGEIGVVTKRRTGFISGRASGGAPCRRARRGRGDGGACCAPSSTRRAPLRMLEKGYFRAVSAWREGALGASPRSDAPSPPSRYGSAKRPSLGLCDARSPAASCSARRARPLKHQP